MRFPRIAFVSAIEGQQRTGASPLEGDLALLFAALCLVRGLLKNNIVRGPTTAPTR